MTPAEAAKVLAIAAAFDGRLRPPSPADAQIRSVVWAEALDDMPPAWAEKAVVTHYADETASLMPAHLNTAWRRHRKAEAEQRHAYQLRAAPDGVPMPPEVRAALGHRIGEIA